MVGAGRKQPVALIVPDWESLNQALAEAGEKAPGPHRTEQVSTRNQDRAAGYLQAYVAIADYERIRRVALLPNEFSIDGGELTPHSKSNAKSSTTVTAS